MMKKVLALAVAGLMVASANAAYVSIVALDGPNAYVGGTPSLLNGGVGTQNIEGTGGSPAEGGPGIVIAAPSATARIGVVVELADPSATVDGVNLFFEAAGLGGTPGSVDISSSDLVATNSFGNAWVAGIYANGTGLKDWDDAGQVGNSGAFNGTFIENYHLLASDQVSKGGEGGNTGGSFLLNEIVVHGVIGNADGSVYDMVGFSSSQMEVFNDFALLSYIAGGGPVSDHLTQWAARNGYNRKSGFPIVVLPEPGALSLLALGGLAVIRRRK
jgi:hypothetical protein